MATATASRTSELEELLERVQSADVNDNTVFHGLFRDCKIVLELSDQAAADALMVTRPTVNRWARGQNLPHRALRSHLRDWMEGQLSRKIKLRETARGCVNAYGAAKSA
jgi:hypothetical protein